MAVRLGGIVACDCPGAIDLGYPGVGVGCFRDHTAASRHHPLQGRHSGRGPDPPDDRG